MTVGDHQIRVSHVATSGFGSLTQSVLDAGLVGGGPGGSPAIASSRNAANGSLGPGTPRGCSTGSSGPRASTGGVLDRPGHRLLVRHDRAARVLELHGADHALIARRRPCSENRISYG